MLNKHALALLALIAACFFGSSLALAQSSDVAAPSEDEGVNTVFHHSATSRFWVSGQLNVILQWHPPFKAKYSGPNSLSAEGEHATSRVLTLYAGAQLTNTTEVFCDIESAGGNGISAALGLAGFTNLDVVRNPTL